MFKAFRSTLIWALEDQPVAGPSSTPGSSSSTAERAPVLSRSTTTAVPVEDMDKTRDLLASTAPLEISTAALDFGDASSSRTTRKITIRNPNIPGSFFDPSKPSPPPIVWKALTTLVHQYCVRPNMGVLQAGESVEVEFIREPKEAFFKDAKSMKRQPAFLVQSSPFLPSWAPSLVREGKKNRDDIMDLWTKLRQTSHPRPPLHKFRIDGNVFTLPPTDTFTPYTPSTSGTSGLTLLSSNRGAPSFAPSSSSSGSAPSNASSSTRTRSSPSKRIRRELPVVPSLPPPERRPSEMSTSSAAVDEPDEWRRLPSRNASIDTNTDTDARTSRFASTSTDASAASADSNPELERLRRENALLRSQLSSMTLTAHASNSSLHLPPRASRGAHEELFGSRREDGYGSDIADDEPVPSYEEAIGEGNSD